MLSGVNVDGITKGIVSENGDEIVHEGEEGEKAILDYHGAYNTT